MLFTKNLPFPIAALKYIAQLDMCHKRFDVNGIILTIISNYWFKNHGETWKALEAMGLEQVEKIK